MVVVMLATVKSNNNQIGRDKIRQFQKLKKHSSLGLLSIQKSEEYVKAFLHGIITKFHSDNSELLRGG